MQPSDDHIAAKFIQGDPETYRLVMSWIKARVAWIARDSAVNREDLAGECILALCQAIKSGRYRGAGLKSFINAIITHKYFDWLDNRNRTEYHPPELIEAVPGVSPSPEERALSIIRAARLRAALLQLDETDRLAVVLRRIGLEYADIGKRLGISSGAVRKRVCEARQRLAQLIEKGRKT